MVNQAGRPPRGPEKAVRLEVYVQPATAATLKERAAIGRVPVGALLDEWVAPTARNETELQPSAPVTFGPSAPLYDPLWPSAAKAVAGPMDEVYRRFGHVPKPAGKYGWECELCGISLKSWDGKTPCPGKKES